MLDRILSGYGLPLRSRPDVVVRQLCPLFVAPLLVSASIFASLLSSDDTPSVLSGSAPPGSLPRIWNLSRRLILVPSQFRPSLTACADMNLISLRPHDWRFLVPPLSWIQMDIELSSCMKSPFIRPEFSGRFVPKN
jgi:hypothetical protein